MDGICDFVISVAPSAQSSDPGSRNARGNTYFVLGEITSAVNGASSITNGWQDVRVGSRFGVRLG